MRGTAGRGNQVVVECPCTNTEPETYLSPSAQNEEELYHLHNLMPNTAETGPPLARLLREIRIQIWLYVLDCGGRHYHLMHGDGSITHALCQSGSHESLNSIINPCCSSSQSPCCPETILPYTCFNRQGRGRVVMGIHKPWHKLLRVDLTLLRA